MHPNRLASRLVSFTLLLFAAPPFAAAQKLYTAYISTSPAAMSSLSPAT